MSIAQTVFMLNLCKSLNALTQFYCATPTTSTTTLAAIKTTPPPPSTPTPTSKGSSVNLRSQQTNDCDKEPFFYVPTGVRQASKVRQVRRMWKVWKICILFMRCFFTFSPCINILTLACASRYLRKVIEIFHFSRVKLVLLNLLEQKENKC